MSARFVSTDRLGKGPEFSKSRSSSNFETPPSTNLKLRMSTPSSARFFENGGMEPGVMPPISAWCARLAVKKSGFSEVGRGTGGEGETKGADCKLRIANCEL